MVDLDGFDVDDLFLEIEEEPEPVVVVVEEPKLDAKGIEEDVLPPRPTLDEEQQDAIDQEHTLAKIELTRDEKLEKAAELLGVNCTDFEGGDDEFLTHVALEYKVILGLYMLGKSPTYISRAIESTPYKVSKVLSSPQNLNIINHWKKAVEIELDGLFPLVIEAVREGLNSGDRKVKLMAVDRYVKLRGDGMDQTGVTVQIVHDARGSFLENLKTIAEAKGVLEADFKEINNAPAK